MVAMGTWTSFFGKGESFTTIFVGFPVGCRMSSPSIYPYELRIFYDSHQTYQFIFTFMAITSNILLSILVSFLITHWLGDCTFLPLRRCCLPLHHQDGKRTWLFGKWNYLKMYRICIYIDIFNCILIYIYISCPIKNYIGDFPWPATLLFFLGGGV